MTAAVVTAAVVRVGLDLRRDPLATRVVGVDLDREAFGQAGEAAPDPLELGPAVHFDGQLGAALGADLDGLGRRVLRDHGGVDVADGRLGPSREDDYSERRADGADDEYGRDTLPH